MKIQLIRSATVRIDYAQQKFVIDPYLAAKHAMPSYTGASPNPLVELPCPPQEVIDGIDMAIISHLHSDHFDPTAQRLLPAELPILCQPGDESGLEGKGFRSVTPVIDSLSWKDIRITRTTGQHGTGQVLQEMGDASGFVFQAENEPTVYWAGDTVWCESVADVIDQIQPDIIITHSCGAVWGDNVLIVMDAAQTVAVCRAAPNSVVIATHMDSLDHTTISREALRAYAEVNGISSERLLIPADGEKLAL
ncbi:MAG: MBL fold metallo-hydrolase [Chloroflexi bacterium]|nr:MBL fold metallo-hydrolase [Chloroflexota bacterium]